MALCTGFRSPRMVVTVFCRGEEVVNVPGNLSDFASDPKFGQILLKVKVQTSINFVDLQRNTETNKVLAIVINAPTSETAGNARRLVETHFKNQIKIMSAEAKLAKTDGTLSAQGEVQRHDGGLLVHPVIGLVLERPVPVLSRLRRRLACLASTWTATQER